MLRTHDEVANSTASLLWLSDKLLMPPWTCTHVRRNVAALRANVGVSCTTACLAEQQHDDASDQPASLKSEVSPTSSLTSRWKSGDDHTEAEAQLTSNSTRSECAGTPALRQVLTVSWDSRPVASPCQCRLPQNDPAAVVRRTHGRRSGLTLA